MLCTSLARRSLCLPGSLDPAKVRGKIVVCAIGTNARAQKGLVVRQAWGVGMVLCNGARAGDTVLAEPHLVAAAHYSYTQCVRLLNYLRSTEYAMQAEHIEPVQLFAWADQQFVLPH